MSLLNQLFGKYSLLAKAIYEQYLQGKEPVTKEDVDYAVSEYERDHHVQIVPYVEVLKRKIYEKDFNPGKNYYRTKALLNEKWRQREQTKQMNNQLKKTFIKETNAKIEELKGEIIEDKLFISEILCFSLALAYKKEYRRYLRLKSKETHIIDFLDDSPEDYQLFKLYKVNNLIQKRTIPENQKSRIIQQTMRFIKSIEKRDR
jgi:hypothetical protein